MGGEAGVLTEGLVKRDRVRTYGASFVPKVVELDCKSETSSGADGRQSQMQEGIDACKSLSFNYSYCFLLCTELQGLHAANMVAKDCRGELALCDCTRRRRTERTRKQEEEVFAYITY